MNIRIVRSSELGTNCMAPARFCGGECKKLEACKYPEKQGCMAYLKKSQTHIVFAPGSDVGNYQI